MTPPTLLLLLLLILPLPLLAWLCQVAAGIARVDAAGRRLLSCQNCRGLLAVEVAALLLHVGTSTAKRGGAGEMIRVREVWSVVHWDVCRRRVVWCRCY